MIRLRERAANGAGHVGAARLRDFVSPAWRVGYPHRMSAWLASAIADLVMLVHFGFVLFVGAGAFLVLRWRRAAWAHIPCVVYGAAIELFGWICPLTPLEQGLRVTAGEGGYSGGFIEHYVGGLLYPANWNEIHVYLGIGVALLNMALYAWILGRARRRSSRATDLPSGPL